MKVFIIIWANGEQDNRVFSTIEKALKVVDEEVGLEYESDYVVKEVEVL